MTAAGPIMLVRYRPGVAGEAARVVHVVPLPTDAQAGAVGALCGAALMVHDMETVTPGQGMPCTVCALSHVTGTAPAEELRSDDPGAEAGGACYQQWGWPVIFSGAPDRRRPDRPSGGRYRSPPHCLGGLRVVAPGTRCLPVR